MNLFIDGGKEWISISVDPQSHPVNYKGQYHYRTGSTKQELKGSSLNRFLLKKYGQTWDSVLLPEVGIGDLSERAFESFKQKAKTDNRIIVDLIETSNDLLLKRLHQEYDNLIKRSAVLLFHDDPEKYIPGAFVKIGYIRSPTDLALMGIVSEQEI